MSEGRTPKPEWLRQLRSLDGCAEADLRWNGTVGRWEFLLPSADGIRRSQFLGRFQDRQGRPLKPDPVTGLYPFRDLDDAVMREVIANLERTFVGNRFDGAGSTRREVQRRQAFNDAHRRSKYRQAGELFADLVSEHGRQLRGAPLIQVPVTLTK